MQNQECTDFIARIPTTFDETVAIDGQLGEYTVVARRKGSTWYLAAMTDWTERDINIPLGFIGEGTWQMEIFADGVNALKDGTDYRHSRQQAKKEDCLHIHLSSGGGWVAILNR
jgi:alpha-glucosidase